MSSEGNHPDGHVAFFREEVKHLTSGDMNSILFVAIWITLVLVVVVPVAASGQSNPRYYRELDSVTIPECYAGWRRDCHGNCSIAICKPSCIHGTCVRPNTCQCRPGFTDSTCSTDIDECQPQCNSYTVRSTLQCDHMCINSIGSYRCDCESGFVLGSDRHSCIDIDECSMTRTHNCQQKCINTPGSFRCDCHRGYTLDANGKDCEDINECKAEDTCQQLCMNEKGDYYTCSCFEGFKMYGRYCEDIDECETGEHDCDQICTNGVANFLCSCYEGYELGMDGKTCFDIDECAPTTVKCDKIRICKHVETGKGSICSYIDGSFTELQSGPTGNEGVRLVGGSVPSEGRVEVYKAGYPWSTVYDNGWDINDANVVCRQLNYLGATRAPHNAYFGRGSGSIYLSNIGCTGNEEDIRLCPNAGWSYKYSSSPTYHYNDAGVECDPYIIPRSVLTSVNCFELLICSQIDLAFTCACVKEEGHALSNVSNILSDEGECDNVNPSNPTKLHVCRNSTDAVSCRCVEGYQLFIDKYYCQGENKYNCSSMRNCKNTPGGYECPCKDGYINNIETGECDDIDECSTGLKNNCTDVEICTSVGSAIVCKCFEGDVSVCKYGNCSTDCKDVEVCADGACTCYTGYFPSRGDGCSERMHDCTETETCNNTIGGYECPCKTGFIRGQGVNEKCVEVYGIEKDGHVAQVKSWRSGWLFPLGMICAFVLVAAVVVGRKLIKNLQNGTGTEVPLAQTKQEPVTSPAGAGNPQSTTYESNPSEQPQSAVDDEVGDAESSGTSSPSRGAKQTVVFDDTVV